MNGGEYIVYSILIAILITIILYVWKVYTNQSESQHTKKDSLHYIDFNEKSLNSEQYKKQEEIDNSNHSNTENKETKNFDDSKYIATGNKYNNNKNAIEDVAVAKKTHINYTVDMFIDKSVFHDSFGEGKITKIENDKYINVFFIGLGSDKKFLFPDAFKNHLTIYDENLDDIIEHFLAKNDKSNKDQTPLLLSEKEPQFAVPTKKLLEGHVYSIGSPTNSKNVYAYGCKYFNWKATLKSNFGKMGALLYAKNASPEGYSVWCIRYSNLSPSTTKTKWTNKILGDYIYETWHEIDDGLWSDKTIRIVFVFNGSYYFRGIHQFLEIKQNEKMEYVKVYKRISHKYPN